MIMYMHSKKAVDIGHPENRVFLVVPEAAAKGCGYLAWKTELTPGGLKHPAFVKPLALTENSLRKGFLALGKKG